MTILDANLLLYAYNSDAPQQEMAAAWLRKRSRAAKRSPCRG